MKVKSDEDLYLQLLNNYLDRMFSKNYKLEINTLTPGFNYLNHRGELVIVENKVLF